VSPFFRASSPHLNVTERLSNFSKSCNDLFYNLDQSTEAAAIHRGNFLTGQVFGESDDVLNPDLREGVDVRDGNRPDSRSTFWKNESPVKDLDEKLSTRNKGSHVNHYNKRPWQQQEEKDQAEGVRRTGSERSTRQRVASTRNRTNSMESQSTYDNYHSTKQSFIVRPTCITPINTTNLFYTNPGSRPVTPLDTSDLIYISSRSPTPELLFPPIIKPSPSDRRPRTRSRGTSPLKVSFEEEPSQDKEIDADCSNEAQKTIPGRSRSEKEKTKGCSRCPTPLKNPLRTSSPKLLLDRSISPLDQMLYVPGRNMTPFSNKDLMHSSSEKECDKSDRYFPSSNAEALGKSEEDKIKWSGYDSDGDGYRTANTSPDDGTPWW
jgi:hypothetical protein